MKLFIYSAGGFGKEVFDLARRINNVSNRWDDICFIDGFRHGEFCGAKVFTFDGVIKNFDIGSYELIIARGEPSIRKNIYDLVKKAGVRLATLIDGSAIISPDAKLGDGVIALAKCIVSHSATVGDNTALDNNTLIGHDVRIAEHCLVSPSANIAGNCTIGNCSYIGMGSLIKQGTKIGNNVIVSMGSVVHGDIEDGMIVVGNPARPVRKNIDKKVFRTNREIKEDSYEQ